LSPEKDIVARFKAAWQPPGWPYPADRDMSREEASLTLLLSGGGDSTALFHLLLAAGYPFSCLHFRHDSPGDFAQTSVAFCQRLCQQVGVALEVQPALASEVSQQGDLSWEAAASLLRYREVARRTGIFLTAHTADDQAETLVMRLLDGAALAGLAGIRAVRGGRVQRPLLAFRRSQLRCFLEDIKADWVEDPSNLEGNDRARLRSRLMPELERYNPALVAALCRTAQSLAADEDALTGLAGDWLEAHTVEGDHWSLQALQALHPSIRHRVLREIWRQASDGTRRPLGGVFRECERLVMSGLDDRKVTFPGGCRLRKIGAWLWLEPLCEAVPWEVLIPKRMAQPLRTPSWVLLGPHHVDDFGPEWIRLPLPAGVFAEGKQYVLRTRQPGDTYRGERCLKKLLAATGHPPWVRDRWPVLACDDQVMAVPGLTTGHDGGQGTLLFRPQCWRWRRRKMKL
jgi:tRNA(Ile)-lysidine synthase